MRFSTIFNAGSDNNFIFPDLVSEAVRKKLRLPAVIAATRRANMKKTSEIIKPFDDVRNMDLGEPSYQYTGRGGLSWGIPYVAGVPALGWQTNPGLSGEEMVSLLFDTAYDKGDGSLIINYVEFIKKIPWN